MTPFLMSKPGTWVTPFLSVHGASEVRAADVPDLTGRRIVVSQPGGPVFHRRAVSEPYVDGASGDVSVTVCSEHDWYRWAITREPPRAEPCPIYLVWVE